MPLDDVLRAFLRTNVDYYRPVFVRMAREGAMFHANFAALLLTPIWLAYRGFYVALGVLYAVPAAAAVLNTLFYLLVSPWPIPQLVLLGPFLASVGFGSFGNYLLYRRFRRLIGDRSVPSDQILTRVDGRGLGPPVARAVATTAVLILFVAYPLAVVVSALANPPGSLD
ncbi:DUF2628 domain-containing protein [Oharaeibacter diazotrophicus]|uniref:DUF2628 domain-containing protein n=1 Tax=Oharaeibacter diazotrophicus TaxID=1920512 RepID=UPI000F8425D0|nr:DUF2628 domain-containing protein [Oharaeibacter diazotrophicus]